jgi:hypothetical protein
MIAFLFIGLHSLSAVIFVDWNGRCFACRAGWRHGRNRRGWRLTWNRRRYVRRHRKIVAYWTAAGLH